MINPRVAAIIQARMGSTRFPGKVLKPLAGKPVLWHIIHRLRKCWTVDAIAVATSVNPIDDVLMKFCREQEIPCVRGSEDNVLERYLRAAKELGAAVVIRVTGDAPLIDTETIDELVERIIRKKTDYCSISLDPPSIHEGFSVFTLEALEKLAIVAGDDLIAKEHISPYFRSHPELFSQTFTSIKPEHVIKGSHVSIDLEEDLSRLETIYRLSDAKPGDIDSKTVIDILKTDLKILADAT